MAEAAEAHLQGPGQTRYLDALDAQRDNLLTALRWSETEGEADRLAAGARLAGALWPFWQVRGYWREGREHLETLLKYGEAIGPCHPAPRLKMLYGAGVLCGLLGDYQAARARQEECLALARAVKDQRAAANALHELAVLALTRNEVPLARDLHEESLALRREMGDEAGIALSLNNLGNLAYDQNEPDRAHTLYQESLALRRRLGDKKALAATLNNLGNLAISRADYAVAQAYLEESLSLWRALGDRWGIALALGNLAEVAQKEGDLTRAHSLNAQCLTMRWELGDQKLLAGSFEAYGHLLAAERRWAEAAALLGAAQQVRESLGITVRPSEQPLYDRNIATIRAALGESGFAAGWTRGFTMTREQVFAYALASAHPDQSRPARNE
jgi:tetratricopeptide (TPR) repeat protein